MHINYALFIVHPDGFEHYAGYWRYRQDARRQGKRVCEDRGLNYRVARITPALLDRIERGWWHETEGAA